MKKVYITMLASVFFTPVLVAQPAKPGSTNVGSPAQSECAALNAAKGEGKFTGQISTPPNGSSLEVSYGDQSVLVHYSSAVTVCEGGQPASVSALTSGAGVVVFGPLRRNGKNMEMNATKIIVAGPPQTVRPAAEPVRVSSPGMPPAAKSVADNYNAPPALPAGAGQQPPASISCSALLFSINAGREGVSGKGIGRSSVSSITCKKAVDQSAMQLVQDAVTGRRLATVRLTSQNQLEVQLENAEITTIQFTTENGSQVVEISFSSQKAEISHPSSGTKISL